jgi:hypothetical protein
MPSQIRIGLAGLPFCAALATALSLVPGGDSEQAMVAMARGDESASGSGAAESVRLSEAHVAAVNRRRRIYVNNDVGYDAVARGPKLTAIKPEEWIAARFSAFDQPGSQVDCVGWCLDEGNIAAYPSKIIPELQYPTLLRWRKEGVDVAQRIVEESHRRKLEVFWEHRLNGADREAEFLLSVRVADTVPGCHFDGMDFKTWVRHSLVDMIIIGTRSIQVDLAGFKRITTGSHVKLFRTRHRQAETCSRWMAAGRSNAGSRSRWRRSKSMSDTVRTNGRCPQPPGVHQVR